MKERTNDSPVRTVLAHAVTALLTLALAAILFGGRMRPGRLIPAQIADGSSATNSLPTQPGRSVKQPHPDSLPLKKPQPPRMTCSRTSIPMSETT